MDASDAALVGTRPGGLDLDQPMIVGSPIGLEVVALVVQQPSDVFQAVLNAYRDEGNALGDDAEAVWTAHALQAVRVPMENLSPLLDGFESGSRIAGGGGGGAAGVGGARQWVGQTPDWQEVARGVRFPRGVTLAMDRERVELPPGRLRLLARAWVIPLPAGEDQGGGAGAGLRVELCVQHELAESARGTGGSLGLDGLAPPPAPTAMNEGILLPTLSASLTLREGEAVVIVPRETTQTPPGSPDARDADGETALRATAGPIGVGQVSRDDGRGAAEAASPLAYGPQPQEDAGPGRAGPPAPRLPTVGAALLGESRVGGVRADRRQVIVLIPRLPASFELLER